MHLPQSFLDPVKLAGAICTLAIFSLVFKENKVYRLFEHIFIGLAVGYDLGTNWTQVLRPKWWDPMVHDGAWAWAMTVPIGLMFYGIYTKKFAWMSRLLFGVLFGLTATNIFQDFCGGFMPQVVTSYKPLVPPPANPHDQLATLHATSYVINNVLFMLILTCVLIYFFFAFEQKSKIVQGASKSGRLVLMGAFGAIFGSTIMTRMALLIDRIYYLLHDWLGLVK
jgi:uncharacterized membrane protein